jgi:general secretion pathway protein E
MVFIPPPLPPTSSSGARPRLGELLVRFGRLSHRDLEQALTAQAEASDLLGRVLVRLGILSEADVARALSAQLGLKVAANDDFPEAPLQVPGVEPDYLLSHFALPLKVEDGMLYVAMATPQDELTVKALRLATGLWVRPRVAIESELRAALKRLYESESEGETEAKTLHSPEDEDKSEGEDTGGDANDAGGESVADQATVDSEPAACFEDLASEAPAIHFVDQAIVRGVELGASDIHFEPFEDGLHVRYRVDGLLREAGRAEAALAAAVISRIKLMAHLNIAERHVPQNGRIRHQNHALELRISILPTLYGESVAVHVFDRGNRPRLEDMGFSSELLERYRELLGRPHGLLLVTGLAGSGRTATLHASLAELDARALKILTVEDPVEYPLAGVHQVQPHTGMRFAGALRSVLRQDPDLLMLDEMRDVETARITVQSALAHRIFSSLHAETATGAIVRLVEMGIEPYLVSAVLNGVLSQRLVRKLCPHCRKSVVPASGTMQEIGLTRLMPPGTESIFAAEGCAECGHTGYLGRTAIHELFVLDDAARRAILSGADAAGLDDIARRSGMSTFRRDGLRKVAAGICSLEEVLRVTHDRES